MQHSQLATVISSANAMYTIIKILLAVVVCLIHYSVAVPTDFHSSSVGFSGVGRGGGPVGYNGPKAVPVVLSNGHIADTPAVTAAKNAHYTALSQVKTSVTYSSGCSGGCAGAYHGPQAVPVVLPSGHLADTNDVAAAKGRHYIALTKASASSEFSNGDDGSYKQGGAYHH